MELTQEEKAARLQQAVINSPVEEISKLYDELGAVEMSAPALGLACRFRGLAMVETLVGKGATFDFPSTKKIEETYDCYIGQKHKNYRTNYSMYLLRAFGEELKIFCLHGMTMEQSAKREDGESLPFLSDEERAAVLKYLMENREKTAFRPEELLFYAIYFRDTVLVKELKKQNVKISDIRIKIITDGATAMNGYWFEYVVLTERLADEDYLAVMQQLAAELDGKPFHYTAHIYEITKRRFRDFKVVEFFFSHFKKDKINQRDIMRDLIEEGILEAMPLVEAEGWLALPRKRDEMIAYASEKSQTEILAWLLEYKNRTADFAAEQEKAEKKMMRELNMAPDSVAALKKIWNYRKGEDGTLVITNYKGSEIHVTVPEKIGKNTVTAIGNGAFAGSPNSYNGCATAEQINHHNKIVGIILPGTVRSIGKWTFMGMSALKEIDLPEGLQEIGVYAFDRCSSLKSIHIPSGVNEISQGAFERCTLLQDITISDGVKEIGDYAFGNCSALRSITIPGSVERVGTFAWNKSINLEKAEICKGVKVIDAYAFYDCRSLRSITIPQTVEIVGQHAFHDCHKLEVVCISEGVREINAYAFQNCSSLKSITIPKTVETIGQCAFVECSSLEEVCICGEVDKIGALAFLNCSSLKVIRVLKSIPNRILGETFERNHNLVIYCPKGSKTQNYCKKKGIPYEESDV